MTTMSSALVKMIGKDLQAAAEAIEAKYGVKITYAGGTFSNANATVKLSIAAVAADGEVLTREAQDFKRHAHMFGLAPSDLGRRFSVAGNEYEVTGLKPKSLKYPVLAKNVRTSTVYRFPVSAVLGTRTLY